eukprot:TRINITY_DN4830_c0_g3_i2.p1 TRINITY_DN4830_c0_g3~~TRINITY_DN4830_c0_g3_i2.p1  ORF type:complete len:268 (-),score=109.20 TRINITY_DN4830_c0_g3_i2:181-984(-)
MPFKIPSECNNDNFLTMLKYLNANEVPKFELDINNCSKIENIEEFEKGKEIYQMYKRQLYLSGLLVSNSEYDSKISKWRSIISKAKIDLKEEGIALLDEPILDDQLIDALADHCREVEFRSCQVDEGYFVLWKESIVSHLTIQLSPFMREVCQDSNLIPGKPLILYYPSNSFIGMHIDEYPSYKFSIGFVVDFKGGDLAWGLSMIPKKKRGWLSLRLKKGQCFVFRGQSCLHWRERLPKNCSIISISLAWDTKQSLEFYLKQQETND